jgi:hypothetical protein
LVVCMVGMQSFRGCGTLHSTKDKMQVYEGTKGGLWDMLQATIKDSSRQPTLCSDKHPFARTSIGFILMYSYFKY